MMLLALTGLNKGKFHKNVTIQQGHTEFTLNGKYFPVYKHGTLTSMELKHGVQQQRLQGDTKLWNCGFGDE